MSSLEKLSIRGLDFDMAMMVVKYKLDKLLHPTPTRKALLTRDSYFPFN
jgi:hypothetical protein